VTTEVLLVERLDGRHEITLNRPAKRNAMNVELASALVAALRDFDADDSASVAVITGADPAFCAGMDLTDTSWATSNRVKPADTFSAALRALGKPLIAAVNGPAITGGLELVLSCDFAIASKRALFGDTHARVGLFPGGGMTVHLAEAVGVRRARQLSYTGELFGAPTALRLGLVNEVVPHDDLLPRVRAIASAMAEVDPSLLVELRLAYHRRSVVGAEEALDAELAVSHRRRVDAAHIAAVRDGVIARGRSRLHG
jgi:enoyl-CoA hydratase